MVAAIRQLGSTTTRVIGDLGAMGLFLVEVARDAVTAPWRLRNVVDEVYKLGFLSLLIISISGLAVGMVLASRATTPWSASAPRSRWARSSA